MKLKWVKIENFKSCKNINFEVSSLHALVGANNSGKTTILKALDLMFNPTVTKVDEECFWNNDLSLKIWIEAIFDELTEPEITNLKGYLKPDNTFHIARSIVMEHTEEDDEESKKPIISQHYCKPVPKVKWLRDAEINGKNISEWIKTKNDIQINGVNFIDFLGTEKPQVGIWKEKAKEFIDYHLSDDDFEEDWADNPTGYAGVLKGTLPSYIYIPAVKDLSEETKVTKSNPFGKLLYRIIENITSTQREEINGFLSQVQNKLNRVGGDDRLDIISKTEEKLNLILNDYMPANLEIEFQSPEIDMLLTTPKIFIDDGFRNVAQNKGHGLQRSVIFSILQLYSEMFSAHEGEKRQTTIFAVEEPEIYMHPLAQRNIRKVFMTISARTDQVIFATHSSLLLDVAYFDEIIRVEIIKTAIDGHQHMESIKWQLPMHKMIADLEIRYPQLVGRASADSIRDLYSHAYHPTRSEGFFAKKIILVEGPTEQYSLPIYAEALDINFDKLNISIVDSGGKGSMDRLYRMFNELGIPCYLIIDYDIGNEDKTIINKSKELLSLVGENDSDPKQITVYEKAACFPHTWEKDIEPEIKNYAELKKQAREELGLSKESGKPLVARFIARKLVAQSPPIVPVSIEKIIKKAIGIEWEKSCLSS